MKSKYISIGVVGLLLLLAFLLGRRSVPSGSSSKPEGIVKVSSPVPAPSDEPTVTPGLEETFPLKVAPSNRRDATSMLFLHGEPSYATDMTVFASRLKDIALTPSQIQQLQEVYTAMYDARIDYEISKAKVGILSQKESLLEIPSYNNFGEQLKKSTYSMFESVLGADLTQKVAQQIGNAIDAANQDWGRYPQTLLVSYDASTSTYKITHTQNPNPSGTDRYQRTIDSVLRDDQLDSYASFLPLFPKRQ